MTPVSIALAHATVSSAPVPPSRWPVIDLVEEIATLRAASSPSAFLMTSVSTLSFIWVEVPWALM